MQYGKIMEKLKFPFYRWEKFLVTLGVYLGRSWMELLEVVLSRVSVQVQSLISSFGYHGQLQLLH